MDISATKLMLLSFTTAAATAVAAAVIVVPTMAYVFSLFFSSCLHRSDAIYRFCDGIV